MSAGGAEIAEDYKNSLEDLAINSRYEINNLTVIARENTNHAVEISRAIENHIRKVSLKYIEGIEIQQPNLSDPTSQS